jgi:hypothetical protein
VKHRAHSERLIGPIASDIAREVETLCAGTPAGEAQFVAARAVLARKLARLRIRCLVARVVTYRQRPMSIQVQTSYRLGASILILNNASSMAPDPNAAVSFPGK